MVNDGEDVGNIRGGHQENLNLLFARISPNAILNAGGHSDEVRCYPGTRDEVIEKIETWMDEQSEQGPRMLWLSGHAGAGKSAIAQTVAERGVERRLHSANFFFLRSDNSRNHARGLVATLIHQLIDFYPTLLEHITDFLTTKPLTPKGSVEEHFARLVASPIQCIRQSLSITQPIILILDGLDECVDEVAQVQILSAIYALVSRDGSPFRVMVASRAEPHLVEFFNEIKNSVKSIFLNDEYRPRDDICNFVTAKFRDIKRTHYLAHTLRSDWPSSEDISEITYMSSGQFIYAATVMRFIEYSRKNPALSLLTVHQARQSSGSSHSPFAQLDAQYSHVFSKARDLKAIQWTLYLHSTQIPIYWVRIMQLAGYQNNELRSLFADISSIAQIVIDQSGFMVVDFYRASLPDYLADASRSGIYHVDTRKIPEDLSTTRLRRCHDTESFDIAIMVLKYVDVLTTTKLSESLLDTSQRRFGPRFTRPFYWSKFLESIVRLYFELDTALCKRILRGWIRFACIHKFNTGLDEPVENKIAYRYYERYRVIEKVKVALMRALKLI